MPQVSELAKKFSALGHPLRLRIVVTLVKGEMYLNEIAKELNVSRALAKIHLKKLQKAGIVKTRIVLAKGEAKAFRYYELKPFDIHVSPQILKEEVKSNRK